MNYQYKYSQKDLYIVSTFLLKNPEYANISHFNSLTAGNKIFSVSLKSLFSVYVTCASFIPDRNWQQISCDVTNRACTDLKLRFVLS